MPRKRNEEISERNREVWKAAYELCEFLKHSPTQKQIGQRVKMSQSRVGQHLKILRSFKVVDFDECSPRTLRILVPPDTSGNGSRRRK